MIRKFLTILAVVLSVSGLVFFQVAYAAIGDEGQIEGGDIYRVRNVTKNTSFTDPANADACDILQYKVRIHNPGPSFLSNVSVKVTLPASVATHNTSTVTLSSVNADPKSTSDTATVNLSTAQSITYTSGTTQLLDTNNNFIRALPDGITQGGVSIGDQGVSIDKIRYVQFKAKVNCPPPPEKPPEKPPEQPPETPPKQPPAKPPVITTQVKPSAQPQRQQPPQQQPAVLPDAGPGEIVGIFLSVASAGSMSYYLVYRRLAPLL